MISSLQGNLAVGEYTKSTVEIADQFQDFVIGFICTSKVSENPAHIFFTPGEWMQRGLLFSEFSTNVLKFKNNFSVIYTI